MSTGIVFRTNDGGRWGTGKGANLTPQEVDLNFWELLSRLVTVEGSVTRSIASITSAGSQMTITYTDATTDIVALPYAAFKWRDDWLPATPYVILDVVRVSGLGIYLVLKTHESAGETIGFDPDATEGGQPLYELLLPDLTPQDNADEIEFGYIVETADDGRTKKFYGSETEGPTSVTIDLEANAPFRQGGEVTFVQADVSGIGFEAVTGVNLHWPADKSPLTRTQWSVVSLRKIGADDWVLSGDLADATV